MQTEYICDCFGYSVIVVAGYSNRYEAHSILIDIRCLDFS